MLDVKQVQHPVQQLLLFIKVSWVVAREGRGPRWDYYYQPVCVKPGFSEDLTSSVWHFFFKLSLICGKWLMCFSHCLKSVWAISKRWTKFAAISLVLQILFYSNTMLWNSLPFPICCLNPATIKARRRAGLAAKFQTKRKQMAQVTVLAENAIFSSKKSHAQRLPKTWPWNSRWSTDSRKGEHKMISTSATYRVKRCRLL